MATNNKSRDSRRRQRLWCTAKEQIKADGTAEYNAKISATHDASDYEHKEEEVGEDSTTYLKSVIKTYQEKMGEDSTTYLKSVIKSSPWMAARQRRDLALCEVTDFFKIAAEAIPEVEAKFPADEDYTDEQMQEDMIKRTNTPLVPWFQKHVRRSAKRSFTPEYMMLGLVEQISKYKQERGTVEDWPPVGKQLDEIIDRAGNIYWYIYGLCGALEDILPETIEEDGYDWYNADFRMVFGHLCGAFKDYTAEGEDWAVLRPRVQAHVSRVLRHVAGGAVCPAEEAMRVNIAKIRGKKD